MAKAKKQFFLVEILFPDKTMKQFMVEADSYGDACVKSSIHVPGGDWKLLGIFEKMETDKFVHQRIM